MSELFSCKKRVRRPRFRSEDLKKPKKYHFIYKNNNLTRKDMTLAKHRGISKTQLVMDSISTRGLQVFTEFINEIGFILN